MVDGNFVPRFEWKAHGSPVTKYFGSMEANSLLRNFLPYLDPVTPSGRLTNTRLYRLQVFQSYRLERRYGLKSFFSVKKLNEGVGERSFHIFVVFDLRGKGKVKTKRFGFCTW